jgi:F-type H+-transporting ATPase subunit delta
MLTASRAPSGIGARAFYCNEIKKITTGAQFPRCARGRGEVATEEPQISGLAGRYATALFELAQEERSVETVERDFTALKALVDQNADLRLLVRAPVFSRKEQEKGMDAILRRMEAAPLTVRFVLLLASKGRLFALMDVIRAFELLAAKLRGEVRAEVTSARALSDAEVTELKAVLKSRLGRDARLDAKVDPSLLGGLVVKVGSRMIDSSLRTKLDGLRAAMRGQ